MSGDNGLLKTFGGILGCAMVLPLGCAFGYLLISVIFMAAMASVLPGWAQDDVLAWMTDHPQETYDGEIETGGAVPLEGGYEGEETFACLLPPDEGYNTDTYGVPRSGGTIHRGIDYGCFYHSVPVRTPMGGKVVYSGYSSAGYGNLVVIENKGVRLYLAHNEVNHVEVGDIVRSGDTIGMCGNTGNSDGYHVHLEVRVWNGNTWSPRDPYNVLLPGQSEACDWYDLKLPRKEQPPAKP